MSTASKLLAIPRSDVIPGFTISPATLRHIAQVEQELERRHIAAAGSASVGLPDKIADKIIKAATDAVAEGRFKYGRQAYDSHVLSPTMTPYLLWLVLTLQPNNASVARDQAEALITPETEPRIARAVLESFGWNFSPKGSADPNAQGAAGSISAPSSPPSENADSATAK